jgi:hypothetical protein
MARWRVGNAIFIVRVVAVPNRPNPVSVSLGDSTTDSFGKEKGVETATDVACRQLDL